MKTLIIFCFICIAQIALAQDINFSWTHESSDSVTGYNFYVREHPTVEFVKIWTGTEARYTFNATDGTKYGFAVTAFNGLAESLRSVELVYTAEGNVGDPIIIPSRPTVIMMKFN